MPISIHVFCKMLILIKLVHDIAFSDFPRKSYTLILVYLDMGATCLNVDIVCYALNSVKMIYNSENEGCQINNNNNKIN